MRKFAVAALFVAVVGATPVAQAHPSENRNENGFGGGPHCHVVLKSENDNAAYPSHTGHTHSGSDVFAADPDCDGDAG